MLLWRSPVIIGVGVALALIVYVIGFRSWFASAKAIPVGPVSSSGEVPKHVGAGLGVSSQKTPGVRPDEKERLLIVGTVCSGDECYISLSDGRMMSPERLVSMLGAGVVHLRDGIKYVESEGVQYVGVGYNVN